MSKANLISSVYTIVKQNSNYINYFPSYEIVMDELRDYRFYKEDMLHPNQQAIDYIWNKLSTSFFSTETLKVVQEIETIQKGLAHRPFNPNAEAHKKFLIQLEFKIKELNKKYDFLNFS